MKPCLYPVRVRCHLRAHAELEENFLTCCISRVISHSFVGGRKMPIRRNTAYNCYAMAMSDTHLGKERPFDLILGRE